jgi:hypothetical protein
MRDPDPESFEPELSQAQQTLVAALEEACRVDASELDVAKVDTRELIRMDEAFAAASQAAKEAVSLRLRTDQAKEQAAEREAEAGPRTSPAHRVFNDVQGNQWHAFAVKGSSAMEERRALPEAFRRGWLVFESNDELRRLAPVPDNWEELSVDALRGLCQRALAARRRGAPPRAGTDSDRLLT